ncbi:Sulfate/thiosulfate import ATP-binding protein CysA [Aquimixticola soesokkakensis]|uniref:Sulfate/thiosulfate import ATP-binding protein CysA n=1 Tax=Aquimixticola soesokkakensis TaxID=1519096 RepID=A0A1Y5RUC5_9RHOB|nr:ATP-binding cassette domain-containing protein [Aquimixticola soesokkakensis]SLN25390.1 Sulfate/thiosulfate import ATP-binding protein CysA [Aquimixticola soesokkakensis]
MTRQGATRALSFDISAARVGGSAVLGAIRFELGQGECVALCGPSGIGKSTILRVIAGLETDFDGRVACAPRIGMVFQEPVLLPWRVARDNLRLLAKIDAPTAQGWLERVGLGACADRFPGQLSLGQQRRLSLARAFAATPDVLLLDEPFVSLDSDMADEMMALFEGLHRARPIATLIVTHVEAEASRLATRILRLAGRPARLV